MSIAAKLLASGAGWSVNDFVCTSGQYMLHTRLRRAAVKLRRSRAAVATVALDCGYDDLSTFNRQFRRATGLTPGAYRQRRIPLG